ncbi:MAG: hypothetical protein ACREJO_01640 [Phycisphaerales bacterium]
MDNLERRALLGVAGVAGIGALAAMAKAGPLNPPAGAVAPSGRTLDEVYNKIPTIGAADGRIPIPGGSSAVTLSASGSYVLTGNIVVNSGAAIIISADHVTLDLNGYRLQCTNPGPPGTLTVSTDRTDITIRNGIIVGGGSGLDVRNDCLGITITDLHILSTLQYGVLVNSSRSVAVRRCTFTAIGAAATSGVSNITAILFNNSPQPAATDNHINRHNYSGGGSPVYRGIYATSSTFVHFARNTVAATPGFSGTGIGTDFSGVIKDNCVLGYGTPFDYGSGVNGGGNVSQ